jgi:3-deoxy-D-manno-octulosonic-acid transferase
MLQLYNICIRIYYFIAIIASAFSAKAKAWVKGQQMRQFASIKNSIWFHFASLGEYEQGLPVLEAVKKQYPNHPVVITFFSPSGYEIRKNTALADAVYYLPLDTRANAINLIKAINPVVAVFTKYEYWYHYFDQLHQQKIPFYVISAIFRPQQIFFKWYGTLHRKMLMKVTQLFVQDEDSQNLLRTIGVTHATVSGDTRFDRVYANALQPKALPIIKAFKLNSPVFIAGSTWPADEELLVDLIKSHPEWKFVIAPHEIEEERITKLVSLLPADKAIRFSTITSLYSHLQNYQVLVIDNIGMLSSLYQYGDIAYIGGGFGVGIHNTLEAAAFELPVIFGPNYSKFKEARRLITLRGGFSISNNTELFAIVEKLITDNDYRQEAGSIAATFVREGKGATDIILRSIKIPS